MKVGTDGVLLGAWCSVSAGRILDVGTGSGLIALMLAQRCPEAQIDAIDIDADAIGQAAENFRLSKWSDRLSAWQIPLQDFVNGREGIYQLIVSNPPYFVDSLKNPDKQRQTARHTDTLTYSELVSCSAKLLCEGGELALILPAEAEAEILSEAAKNGLSALRLTHVYSKPGKKMKRVLATFQKCPSCQCETRDFYIESESSPRSEEYALLTQDFYL